MTYRSQAVPSYAAYGGVPEEEAYGCVSLEIGLSPAQSLLIKCLMIHVFRE